MMQSDIQQLQIVKEAFLADVQQNSRPCTYLHCSYVIEPASRLEVLPLGNITTATADRLAIRGTMKILHLFYVCLYRYIYTYIASYTSCLLFAVNHKPY